MCIALYRVTRQIPAPQLKIHHRVGKDMEAKGMGNGEEGVFSSVQFCIQFPCTRAVTSHMFYESKF